MRNDILLLCLIMTVPGYAWAKLKVMTTTTNLKSLVEIIGGDKIQVTSYCKGSQDPHFLAAKPSFMPKTARADLLVSVGLDLEDGWLPLIVKGARNPIVRPGQKGRLVVGELVDTLERPVGKMTRADGDVHAQGNPHVLLDPLNAVKIAAKIKDRLTLLDNMNRKEYEKNFMTFSKQIEMKMLEWKKKVRSDSKVITFHKTLSYFYHRFEINNIAYVEEKPGIPPSAGHIIEVIKIAKKHKLQLAIVENYFDPIVVKRIQKNVPNLKIQVVPVAVEGHPQIKTLIDLYDYLVRVMEEA